MSEHEIALKSILLEIKQHDKDYEKRTHLVYQALAVASKCGYNCGIRVDPDEGVEWPVIAIELPNGGVSWHCKATDLRFEGYGNEIKYQRIDEYLVPQKTLAVEKYAKQIGQEIEVQTEVHCLETCPPQIFANTSVSLDSITVSQGFRTTNTETIKNGVYAKLYDELVEQGKI